MDENNQEDHLLVSKVLRGYTNSFLTIIKNTEGWVVYGFYFDHPKTYYRFSPKEQDCGKRDIREYSFLNLADKSQRRQEY
jgi:hypothetical protein